MTQDEGTDQTVIAQIPGLEKEKEKQASLIFLAGPLLGKIHLLQNGTMTLGRGADANLVVNDSGISRQHISLTFANGTATLKDLKSTNGTYVNGKRVEEVKLNDGDQIQLSSTTILKYSYQDNIENVFHKELYRMAVVDALTGAFNKRFFEERVKEEFSYCLRNKVPLSLLMFDIDHFKKCNDTYGHPAGDYILGKIAAIAKSVIRSEDVFARYGGEEFVMILKSTDAPGAIILAERLRSQIEESPFEFEGKTLKVTVSIGLATLTDGNFTLWEEMLKLADTLLYRSKDQGRNRVSF